MADVNIFPDYGGLTCYKISYHCLDALGHSNSYCFSRQVMHTDDEAHKHLADFDSILTPPPGPWGPTWRL